MNRFDIFNTISRKGVGRRLLYLVILFSSLITLIATVVQLYLEYDRDIGSIEKQMQEIEKSYLETISASLWNMDITQLKLQIEGIMHLPDMQAVEIRETDSGVSDLLVLSSGEKKENPKMSRELNIIHYDNQNSFAIGTLYVEATADNIYKRLLEKSVIILISQGIKTFLVSIFILYVFHWVVTRHLISISNHVKKFDVYGVLPNLKLQRKNTEEDELDEAVQAINDLNIRLKKAYQELENVNLKLEKRVLERTAQLEAANKELDAFCYSVSHHLRVPLQWTKVPCNVLVEEYKAVLQERGIRLVNQAISGLDELNELIENYLRLSRITAAELIIEEINISALADQVISRIKEDDIKRQLTVEVQSDLHVEGDYRLIEILLFNLIHNAWKYTKYEKEPKIKFGSKALSKKTVFFISDNGVGFNSKDARHLFTPFKRFHTKEEFEGIGIGLASVKRIVARHGGKVWAEAQVDQGATIYFTFSQSGINSENRL